MKKEIVEIDLGFKTGEHEAYKFEDSHSGDDITVGWFNDGSGVFIDVEGVMVSFEPSDIDKLSERLRYAKEHARAIREGSG